MRTTQSAIARLETATNPRVDTLTRYAAAVGATLDLHLQPRTAGTTLGRRGSVIAVTGRSDRDRITATLLLAAELTTRGDRVCVVDTDVQHAELRRFFPGADGSAMRTLRSTDDLDSGYGQALLARSLTDNPEFGQALLAPADPADGNPLFYTGRFFNRAIEALRKDFDHVLVLTPPAELYHDIFRDCVARTADVLIAAADTANIAGTHAWLAHLTGLRPAGVARDAVLIVPVGSSPAAAPRPAEPRWAQTATQHYTAGLDLWWTNVTGTLPDDDATRSWRVGMTDAVLCLLTV